MNKRIQELAVQAKAESSQWLGSKPGITITYDELEKFAELIVWECSDIVADAVDHREPASTYVDKIKQHFGVE